MGPANKPRILDHRLGGTACALLRIVDPPPSRRTLHHQATLEFKKVIKAVATRLRVHRNARAWTLEEAAERYGVEVAYVRRLENGKTNPSLAVLTSVARALGISIAELLRNGER